MGGNASGLGNNPESDLDAPLSPEFVAIQHTSTSTDGASYKTTGGLRSNTTLAQLTNVSNWNTSSNNIAISTTAFTNISFGGFPVEWLDFKAVAGTASVTVSWITARELNNDYFVVENSLDGVEFSELGQVEGAGTTDTPTSYEFIDHSPRADRLYYRVRQVDFDGAFSFTSVMMVNIGEVSGKAKMYPNPVVSDLTVDQFQGEMTIFNVAGQQLSSTLINGSKTIDLSNLEKGMYLVRLVSNTGVVETHRIVK
ncbi:MAG: T9SS type A sorting domain-containing protein [Bacteroidia bacterium]